VLLLYVIGFVAGLVAGISPCILPVLPVVLVAGATAPTTADDTDDAQSSAADGSGAAGNGRATSYRAYAVVAGLVISFSIFTLAGSSLLSALGLPQDFLRDGGLVILGVVAAGLIVPTLGQFLERPFARLGRRQPTGNAGGFVLGLGLGVLFVPCAGPVLAAITVVGATHHVGLGAVVLTVDFALGAAVPLLVFALAGQRVAERVAAFRRRAALARQIGGVVLLATTLLIALNVTDGLQRVVPGYTSALQRHIEGTAYAKRQLASLTGAKSSAGSLGGCVPGLSSLQNCGAAPNFQGISSWLNTSGGHPLSLASLKGQVVLIDFWTYSCINCQRSLPHVESWFSRYHRDGLVVVGVHTPEFAFEHVVANIGQASKQLGVHYPVAVDNGYKTWNAYQNQYWPAEYLLDANGQVRHAAFGEGDYGTTESLIRTLLVDAHPKINLPGRTDVPDKTPKIALTPESYLGYSHGLPNFDGTSITPDQPAAYRFPGSLPSDYLALDGMWTVGKEKATSGPRARLELAFQASHVYLVIGGTGTVKATVGSHTQTVDVSGIPRLYTLVTSPTAESATLVLTFSPGVDAYDFTFG
jgi:cytochrome c biogenesis protein CcdA/thiol-disulfide isomerase/thioredoxin